ncbi:hypothetical protein [Legionella sp. WA2022007384]
MNDLSAPLLSTVNKKCNHLWRIIRIKFRGQALSFELQNSRQSISKSFHASLSDIFKLPPAKTITCSIIFGGNGSLMQLSFWKILNQMEFSAWFYY